MYQNCNDIDSRGAKGKRASTHKMEDYNGIDEESATRLAKTGQPGGTTSRPLCHNGIMRLK